MNTAIQTADQALAEISNQITRREFTRLCLEQINDPATDPQTCRVTCAMLLEHLGHKIVPRKPLAIEGAMFNEREATIARLMAAYLEPRWIN